MPPTGYSGTPVIKKLGITPNTKLLPVNAPSDYFQLLETDVSGQVIGAKETADLVHLFVTSNKQFQAAMKKLEPLIKKNRNIIIWVSWYKKSAGIATDVTEDVIRNYALKHDLVDVKVCAVSNIWSGLKLVVPKAIR
ncbi:MAG TPA: hypothetical protein VD993_18330 [Chitinophagaceae bacterium]|nr:hypothetical protein [Chitinophagaceae bacterium]